MKSALRWLFRFVRNALAVIGLLAVIYHAGFDLSMIVSGSMAPALRGEGGPDSDWLLTERVSYRFREPRRWEVVQFETTDHMIVAKRVVGLPGESVAIENGRVAINGRIIPLPPDLQHLDYLPLGMLSTGHHAECGDGYFVLGDDSQDSYDSRFEGPIARRTIRGRAWLIVWPRRRLGPVKGGQAYLSSRPANPTSAPCPQQRGQASLCAACESLPPGSIPSNGARLTN
jgi:signal peptidase I